MYMLRNPLRKFRNEHFFNFNISHSQNIAILAIHSEKMIGIDIEKIRVFKKQF